jgi:hypothetical protein
MAKLINLTKSAVTLPSRHVVPANGFLDKISNQTIRSTDNWPRINGAILAGKMKVEFDPEQTLTAAPPKSDAPKAAATKSVTAAEPEQGK